MSLDAKFVSQNSWTFNVVSTTKNKVTQNLPAALKTESQRNDLLCRSRVESVKISAPTSGHSITPIFPNRACR